MTRRSIAFPHLSDKHLQAIGFVSASWNALEDVALQYIGELLSIRNNTDLACLGAELEGRNRYAFLRALIHRKLRNKEHIEHLDKTISYIDNELRNSRNRVVHDLWSVTESGEPLRFRYSTTLKRPQSHQPRVLTHIDSEPMNERDVENIANNIIDTLVLLGSYMLIYRRAKARRRERRTRSISR